MTIFLWWRAVMVVDDYYVKQRLGPGLIYLAQWWERGWWRERERLATLEIQVTSGL